MQYNPLIYWFDTYLQVLSQQDSSLSWVQYLVHNKRIKLCWNVGFILHTITCIYIL